MAIASVASRAVERTEVLQKGASGASCAHCGREAVQGSSFCCSGCEAVYGILQARGLGRYYELKRQDPAARRRSASALLDGEGDGTVSAKASYGYLDDPEFIAAYASSDRSSLRFYLEGVHCAACVWLTEKLPELTEGVVAARLDLATGVATVTRGSGGSFARVAQELRRFGYRPHPIAWNESEPARDHETRKDLFRLGVAGACAGNIMLLAAAIYAGADGSFARGFRWISFALYLPVLFYSAVPFFRSAWSSIRARRISIDVPVAFGIAFGTVASVVHAVRGSNELYLDSLSGLIFLLLATRYLLKRVQASALGSTRLIRFLAPSQARRWRDGAWQEVHVDSLRAGDRIEVLPGSVIPADGIVLQGRAHLSCALLTGEAMPVPVEPGGAVLAGTQNLDSRLEIEVVQSGAGTRVAGIVAQMESELVHKAPVVAFADRVGQGFLVITLVLVAVGFALGLPEGWPAALGRAFAVAIVVCPCAFALAVPLAMSVTLGRLARAGVLVKGAEVIEKLSQVKQVYLDKTGTLTRGRLQVRSVVVWEAGLDEAVVLGAAAAVEASSLHPIARAIVRASPGGVSADEVTDFLETPGVGVQARLRGVIWSVSSPKGSMAGPPVMDEGDTWVVVARDGVPVAGIVLADELLPDAESAIAELEKIGVEPSILSGDQASTVFALADRLGISRHRAIAQASPERKGEVLRASPGALMVGDGINDAIAFASAYVSVAVRGGIEASLRAADAYSGQQGVASVARLILISRETLKVIRRSLIFSFIYNCFGVGFALSGHLSPLVAAVLMPLSAASVFLLTIRGTALQRRLLEGEAA